MAKKVLDLEAEAKGAVALEHKIKEMEAELAQDEKFQTFIVQQKAAQLQIAETWKKIEQAMLDNNIKSVKGEWGYITIAERTNFSGDIDKVPSKFIKKELDTTKVAAAYKLEGKLPKGVEISTTKYMTKRIK